MLVLTRHSGERLVIGGDIVVTVLGVDGKKVRLGIVAPKSVRVDRQEIHSRRQTEKACATSEAKDMAVELSLAVNVPNSGAPEYPS